MAKQKLTLSRESTGRFLGVASEGTEDSGKSKRLVRYPNASNALRALLAETSVGEVQVTMTALAGQTLRRVQLEGGKPSPSEPSKPSANALQLILNALPAVDTRPLGMSKPRAQFMPRIGPAEVSDVEALGRVVRIRRQMLDLSQQQLADLAGVGRRFVGDLEAGKPTVELRKTLQACHALGLTLTLSVSDGR